MAHVAQPARAARLGQPSSGSRGSSRLRGPTNARPGLGDVSRLSRDPVRGSAGKSTRSCDSDLFACPPGWVGRVMTWLRRVQIDCYVISPRYPSVSLSASGWRPRSWIWHWSCLSRLSRISSPRSTPATRVVMRANICERPDTPSRSSAGPSRAARTLLLCGIIKTGEVNDWSSINEENRNNILASIRQPSRALKSLRKALERLSKALESSRRLSKVSYRAPRSPRLGCAANEARYHLRSEWLFSGRWGCMIASNWGQFHPHRSSNQSTASPKPTDRSAMEKSNWLMLTTPRLQRDPVRVRLEIQNPVYFSRLLHCDTLKQMIVPWHTTWAPSITLVRSNRCSSASLLASDASDASAAVTSYSFGHPRRVKRTNRLASHLFLHWTCIINGFVSAHLLGSKPELDLFLLLFASLQLLDPVSQRESSPRDADYLSVCPSVRLSEWINRTGSCGSESRVASIRARLRG